MKNKTLNPFFFLAVVLFLLIIIIIATFLIKTYKINEESEKQYSDLTVIRIIDGDTFELASGGIVRLICVDAPEKGKEGYEQASDFLSFLIFYEEVRLEKDIDDKDKYGRLLRYVYVNDEEGNEIFINKELVQERYASLFIYGNNTAKCGEIVE